MMLSLKPNWRAIFITSRYRLPWNDEAERIAATFAKRACLAFSSASDVGASSTSHIRKMGIICNFILELAEKADFAGTPVGLVNTSAFMRTDLHLPRLP